MRTIRKMNNATFSLDQSNNNYTSRIKDSEHKNRISKIPIRIHLVIYKKAGTDL